MAMSRDFYLKSSFVVFMVQLICAWPMRDIYLSLQDEGNLLAWASRMLDGQQPYQDFFLRFMPTNLSILALGFRIFGEQIWVARWYFLLSLSVLAVVIWLLSLELLPPDRAILPVAFFVCVGGNFWPMLSAHWDSTIFALLAILITARASSTLELIPAGVMAGLCVLFLQPRGVSVCLAVGFMGLSRAPRLKRLLALVGGALIPGVIFTGWLLYRGLFGDFWQQAILYNLTTYSEVQAYPFNWGLSLTHTRSLLNGVGQLGQLPFSAWFSWFSNALAFTIVDLVKYTLFLPVLVIGVIALARRPKREKAQLLGGLLVLLLLSTYFSWARANRYHFNFHTPGWYVLLVYLLYRLESRWKRPAQILTGFIGAAFLVHGITNVYGWTQYRFPIQFQRGVLYTDQPEFARQSQQLSGILASRYDGKNLFGFPEIPMVIWLAGGKNPTSFEALAPIFYSDEQFALARKELVESAPTGILFRPSGAGIAENYPFIETADYDAKELEKLKLLTEGARPVAEVGGFYLFQLPADIKSRPLEPRKKTESRPKPVQATPEP